MAASRFRSLSEENIGGWISDGYRIPPSSTCRILHILRKPNSIIANYSMDVLFFLLMVFLANSDISCLQTLTSHFFGIQICQPWNKRSHCFSSHLGFGWHINNDRNKPKNVIKDSEIIDQLIKRAYGNRAVRTAVKTVLSC